jgi:hypothetical protein
MADRGQHEPVSGAVGALPGPADSGNDRKFDKVSSNWQLWLRINCFQDCN